MRKKKEWQHPPTLTLSDLNWLTYQFERANIPLPQTLIPEDGGWFPGWNCNPDDWNEEW